MPHYTSRRNIIQSLAAASIASVAEATLLPLTALASPASSSSSITVDPAYVRHQINPNIYGTFIEDIGRIVYGGVYEEGSPLSDEQGFRKDVLKAAQDWAPTILR